MCFPYATHHLFLSHFFAPKSLVVGSQVPSLTPPRHTSTAAFAFGAHPPARVTGSPPGKPPTGSPSTACSPWTTSTGWTTAWPPPRDPPAAGHRPHRRSAVQGLASTCRPGPLPPSSPPYPCRGRRPAAWEPGAASACPPVPAGPSAFGALLVWLAGVARTLFSRDQVDLISPRWGQRTSPPARKRASFG